MMAKPQTTVETDNDGMIHITRTSDGVKWSLLHIGRCWQLYRPGGKSSDIAGSASSEKAVVRTVRRWLREDKAPGSEVHCTGW